MDLENDWEFIPDEGFLEINDDGAGKEIYSRMYPPTMFSGTTTAVFQMNDHLICPSKSKSTSPDFIQVPKQQHLSSVPIHTELQMDPLPHITAADHNHDQTLQKSSHEVLGADHDHHQDLAAVSQVFFKKTTKEITESIDMIQVSSSWTNVAHEIEGAAAGATNLQFGEGKAAGDPHKLVESGDDQGPLMNNSIWKWSLTGVGAICSFGVAAAAALCVVILSSSRNNNRHQQKLQLQIYTNNKGLKEVGRHRHHEAIASVVRGSSVPITTARITFGGYYDASLRNKL